MSDLHFFKMGVKYPTYLYSVKSEDREKDLEGKFLSFSNATEEPLIIAKAGFQRYLKKSENEWDYVVDNVGAKYWDENGTAYTITELGVEVPSDALLEAPVIPLTLKDQLALVDSECKRRILSEWSLEHQNNVTLGVNGYTDADKANCIGWINSCLEAKAALIADETKLLTIDVKDDANWPTYSA